MPENVTGAVLEVVTAGTTGTSVSGGLLEVVTAVDVSSVRVTSAVLEVVTALDPILHEIWVTGAVLEVVTSPETGTHVSAGLLEVVTAVDVASTQVSGLLLEVVTALDPPVDQKTWISGVLLEALVADVPEPKQPMARTYTGIAELRWGRDLVLAFPDGEVSPTATGDWPTVAGRPNLHAAQRRRIVTTPGQLVHRPAYGGALETFVGALNSASERARLAAGARANALRDPRIEEAVVSVAELGPDQVLVKLTIKPDGEVDTETVSIVSEV